MNSAAKTDERFDGEQHISQSNDATAQASISRADRSQTAERLLQAALDTAVTDGIVAGVNMLVTQHGVQRWYLESGKRSIERDEPMTRDTIFRLYSQSKPITGTAVMMLVERGVIDLAEPVSIYLTGFKNQRVSTEYVGNANGVSSDIPMEMTDIPSSNEKGSDKAKLKDTEKPGDVPCSSDDTDGLQPSVGTDDIRHDDFLTVPCERELTIKDLLTMTSGLPYPDSTFDAGRYASTVFDEVDRRLHTDSPMGTVELANRLGQGPLRFQPGSHWMYGTSADILGAIVEVASGMRFGDFLRTQIFEPLGMTDTAFYVPPEKQYRLAAVYDNPRDPVDLTNAGGPLREVQTNHLGVQYIPSTDPAYQAGGAGLKSTLDDYERFARMLLNGGQLDGVRILEPSTVRFMLSGALALGDEPIKDYQNWQHGYNYNTLMRIAERPGASEAYCNPGEFGWDGWLGTFFCNDPVSDTTFLMMYQLTNSGTTPFTRKVKNIVFSHLDEQSCA